MNEIPTTPNQYKSQWTEEKVKELLKLLDDGRTIYEMTRALGATKNAIIGKLHRLGRKVNGHIMAPYIKPRRTRPRLRIYRTYAAFVPAYNVSEFEMYAEKTELERGVTGGSCDIMGLTTQTCHWPMWGSPDDKEKLYCGAPSKGKVYCEDHMLRAIAPSRKAVTQKPFSLP